MKPFWEVTEREKTVLRLLLKFKGQHKPIPQVAGELAISEKAVRQLLYRLKRRYVKVNRFAQDYRLWRKRLGKYL